jgi:hypothetical protein
MLEGIETEGTMVEDSAGGVALAAWTYVITLSLSRSHGMLNILRISVVTAIEKFTAGEIGR